MLAFVQMMVGGRVHPLIQMQKNKNAKASSNNMADKLMLAMLNVWWLYTIPMQTCHESCMCLHYIVTHILTDVETAT